jgi:hypothetical protein
MQSADWIDLFRRIPESHHDSLMLTTTIGTEIVLQRLIRLEGDFLIAQGRMAGSTDQGKMLVLPYDKLTYLAFNKKMTDAEMSVVLGGPGSAVQFSQAQVPVANANGQATPEAEMETPAPEPPKSTQEAPAAAVAENPHSSRAALPSKTMLLARLRQRLAGETGKPGKPNP